MLISQTIVLLLALIFSIATICQIVLEKESDAKHRILTSILWALFYYLYNY